MVKIELTIVHNNDGNLLIQTDKLVNNSWNSLELDIANAIEKQLDLIITKAHKKTKNIRVHRKVLGGEDEQKI